MLRSGDAAKKMMFRRDKQRPLFESSQRAFNNRPWAGLIGFELWQQLDTLRDLYYATSQA